MKISQPSELGNLFKKVDNLFLINEIVLNESMIEVIFCHSCYTSINKVNLNLLRIHTSNGLQLDNVPKKLNSKDSEQQLIALVLVFQKIKKLPTSRMRVNFDQVITVPINPETVNKQS